MIPRNNYIETLISFKDKELIKVVTGIRRCGKSTLFLLYQDYLLLNGVSKEQIININLEYGEFNHLESSKELFDFVNSQLIIDKMMYIFLDEVQQVKDFQKAINALYVKKNCDVYITGSNAFLLSGELATLLSGRYIEIKMLPLSFSEYCQVFPNNQNVERLYFNYIQNSSFPYALELNKEKDRRQYLQAIFDSVILKDIIYRKKYPDQLMLTSVLRFMFDNVGNICSTKKIADTMTSIGRNISFHTVESYLSSLRDSFILYKVSRYDIKGKQHLKTLDKYYVVDIALRRVLLGNNKENIGYILENIVYLELIRRGYEVYIGKIGDLEVDFVAIGAEGEEYYQVAYTLNDSDGKTLKRELASLEAIKDHNPKYLLTMDLIPLTSHNGIKQKNVLDWLLEDV